MFGKLIDGKLIYAPNNYTKEDGSVIINFNESELFMKMEGFKRVFENIPAFDAATQEIKIARYEETSDNIIIHFQVIDLPTEPDPMEARVIALEEEIAITNNALQDLILSTMMLDEGGEI